MFHLQIFSVAICCLIVVLATADLDQRQEALFTLEENYIFSNESPIVEKNADSLVTCSQYCARDERCKSANFVKEEKKCSLLDKTRKTHLNLLLREQSDVSYLERVRLIIHFILPYILCYVLKGKAHKRREYTKFKSNTIRN